MACGWRGVKVPLFQVGGMRVVIYNFECGERGWMGMGTLGSALEQRWVLDSNGH